MTSYKLNAMSLRCRFNLSFRCYGGNIVMISLWFHFDTILKWLETISQHIKMASFENCNEFMTNKKYLKQRIKF